MSKDFDRGFTDILIVLAAETGRALRVSTTVRDIVEAEDPDVAEQAMSIAALDPEAFLPPLLETIPQLRSDRKLEYRITRTMWDIGEPAVAPLFDFLLLNRKPVSQPQPMVDFEHSTGEDGGRVYCGQAVELTTVFLEFPPK